MAMSRILPKDLAKIFAPEDFGRAIEYAAVAVVSSFSALMVLNQL
jgi:hypothetical protein